MSETVKLPPFGVLAATLRKTTEHLAREIVDPGKSPPEWSELEWAIACSASAIQGISTLLAKRLRWSGPPLWQSFLAEQHEQSLLRHARIGALLDQLDVALRERRVAAIALKGAALRAFDLYEPGERPMGDVDLLVAGRDLLPAAAAMADVGYTELFTSRRHVVYEPRHTAAGRGFGEHVDSPLKIELHTAVAEALPVRNVDITERLQHERLNHGLNGYRTLVALLAHLLLHAAGNMRAHALRQLQLHDIAAVATLLSERDWQALLEEARDADGPWWVFPPLALTARYYPGRIPPDALHAARTACPRILRLATEHQMLTDVSWSNLRIHAFPGIAWSRSPLDALRFIRSRVLPSRVALVELGVAQRLQPQLAQVPWYGVSHGRRILLWLLSRPPRAQTMTSIRAALENADVRTTESG